MDEEFTDAGDYEAVKFYGDFGVDLSSTAAGNFIIGIIVPDVDEKGLPVENILYTSVTATEKLIRDLTDAVAEAKRLDQEFNSNNGD